MTGSRPRQKRKQINKFDAKRNVKNDKRTARLIGTKSVGWKRQKFCKPFESSFLFEESKNESFLSSWNWVGPAIGPRLRSVDAIAGGSIPYGGRNRFGFPTSESVSLGSGAVDLFLNERNGRDAFRLKNK
eukprot:Trichotokara_eunicae@DN6182_c0_g1_i1.p2